MYKKKKIIEKKIFFIYSILFISFIFLNYIVLNKNINDNENILEKKNYLISNLNLDFFNFEIFKNSLLKASEKQTNIQENNFKNFEKFSNEEYKQYLLGTLEKIKKKEIDYYLEIETTNKFTIENVPQDVLNDIVKSTILYEMAFPEKNNLFNFIDDKKEKIINTIALLKSVAKLETGSFNYEYNLFSQTGAYGRYQIIATTLSSILLKLKLDHGFDIENLELTYDFNNKNIYKIINEYTTNIGLNKNFNKIKIKDLEEKYLKYTRIFNYSSLKYLEHQKKSYEKDKAKRYLINELKDNLFLDIDENNKKYEISLRVLEKMEDPIFQGVASLAILNEIMGNINKQYKNPSKNIEKIVYNTLSLYNNDKNYILDRKSNSYITVKEMFGKKGLKYYKNFYNLLVVSNLEYINK